MEYLVYVGVSCKERTSISRADEDVKDTGGKSSFFEKLCNVDSRQTISLTGFDDDGISCCQSRRGFTRHQHQRDIEWGNAYAYSQRFMTDDLRQNGLFSGI